LCHGVGFLEYPTNSPCILQSCIRKLTLIISQTFFFYHRDENEHIVGIKYSTEGCIESLRLEEGFCLGASLVVVVQQEKEAGIRASSSQFSSL